MIENEPLIRFGAFVAIFTAMAAFELWAPRLERPEMAGALRSRRWLVNVSMVVISSVCLRIIFPAAAVGTAIYAQSQGWGLFPAIGMPVVVAGILAFIVLDFAVWLEHLVSHKWPLLWRIHRMHHSDQGFDLTTALRFHPLEIVLSMIWKAAVIVVLGAPVVAVLVFEIVLNGMAMFNHANARLPLGLDRVLRALVVTPDMHRVHHSVVRRETDSNYGFNLSVWDRLFGTYTDQPEAGHDGMRLGLTDYDGPQTANLGWALVLPFRRAGYRLARGAEAEPPRPGYVPKGSTGK
ncbi:sterol desaturase family protein [Roseitalea porphyridii]|uniref:Sterol desaturase family protein n=1 Tax=Roseitalea porphyridii TaxID=1852022 RepID=A0A4P6UW72_9HYPH|nr:sterol desaturase family protein [Roseitalea porphyridii]QBK29457.1 sterol desaturase family protein [Roseitalea porphyridii]